MNTNFSALPDAYPWPFSSPIEGHWYSHPAPARCPHGAPVGEGGCTWQRAPLSHSLYASELLAAGLNVSSMTWKAGMDDVIIDESLSLNNVRVGRQALAALHLPPCGAAPAPPRAPRAGPEGRPGGAEQVLVV